MHATFQYNPKFLPQKELENTFYLHTELLEKTLDEVRHNDQNRHVIIHGASGVGKTTLALRIIQELNEGRQGLVNYYPIIYTEDNYAISSAGEFWLEALLKVSEQTKDGNWLKDYHELRKEKDEQRLYYFAFGRLMQFAEKQGQKLVLLVENIDVLFTQQFSAKETKVLLQTLSSDHRVMILGTSSASSGHQLRKANEIFDLFSYVQLDAISPQQCVTLCEKMWQHEMPLSHVSPVQIVTNGNLRLANQLMSKLSPGRSLDLYPHLLEMVDNNTSYHKYFLDSFATLERKILVVLADLWQPSTAREIAEVSRVNINKISAVLARLVHREVVEVVGLNGRKKSYQVKDRFFNICYLVRHHNDPLSPVRRLVNFMEVFYFDHRLGLQGIDFTKEARNLNCRYFARHDWIIDEEKELSRIPGNPARLVKRIMGQVPLQESEKTSRSEAAESSEDAIIRKLFTSSTGILSDAPIENGLRQILDLNPKSIKAYICLGKFYCDRQNYNKALYIYKRGLTCSDNAIELLNCLGDTYYAQGDFDLAEDAYKRGLTGSTNNVYAQFLLVKLFMAQSRYDEALSLLDKLNRAPLSRSIVLGFLGDVNFEQKNYELAERHYREALLIAMNKRHIVWARLGDLYYKAGRPKEQVKQAYAKALELGHGDCYTLMRMGQLRIANGEHEKALILFKEIVQKHPGNPLYILIVAIEYAILEKWHLANQYLLSTIPLIANFEKPSALVIYYFLNAVKRGQAPLLKQLPMFQRVYQPLWMALTQLGVKTGPSEGDQVAAKELADVMADILAQSQLDPEVALPAEAV